MNCSRLVFCAVVVLACPLAAQVPQYVVARETPSVRGVQPSITFESAEVFTVNGRDRVRLQEDGKLEISASAYGRLPRQQLNRLGTIRRTAQGQWVRIVGPGKRTAILPDGLDFKGTAATGDLWKNVRFALRPSKATKTETALSGLEVLALIPTTNPPAAATTTFVLDSTNFDSFAEQLAALAGATKSFPSAPEIEAIRAFLTKKMLDGYNAFESGGPYPAFLDTVQYAQLSQTAFPGAPRLAPLSKDILDRRSWIESNLSVLRALLNGRNWDDFLQKHLPFERYQGSFPDLVEGRRTALLESARQHVQNGKELISQGRRIEGLQELRLALARNPDNQELQKIVEDARIETSTAVARERERLRKPLPPGSPQEVRFNRNLEFADLYMRDKKFEQAEEELNAAEEVDKDSPRLLLSRARLHEGKNELAQALAVLESYDENVASPERRALAEKTRITVQYNLGKSKEELKKRLDTLYRNGQYVEALNIIPLCLQIDPNDEDFLYYAGILSAILRKNEQAAGKLQSYLTISTSLRGDLKKRDRAYRVLQILQTPRPVATTGSSNWLSGRKLAPDVFYCPESLAFVPRVQSIKGHKMTADFNWTRDGRLTEIRSVFEDDKARYAVGMPGRSTDGIPSAIFFRYYSEPPQVFWVSLEKPEQGDRQEPVRFMRLPSGELQIASADPNAKPTRQYMALLSNPFVNLDVLAYLEGPAAIGFAGNSYFNPFVWDGIHLFYFTYDNLARVESAREIGSNNLVRFTWDGDRLQRLAAYPAEGGPTGTAVYTRAMAYAQNQLVSETVTYAGKSYKIEYKYQGGQLTEASFDDTGAHDGQSRRIRFVQ